MIRRFAIVCAIQLRDVTALPNSMNLSYHSCTHLSSGIDKRGRGVV